MARALLLMALVAAAPAAAELYAERIGPANIARVRVGGPDAIAGVGDWALGNGTLCAAVADPGHETVLSTSGGTLVDVGHCGRADDHFHLLQPLFNFSRKNIPPTQEIRAELEGGEARIVTGGVRDGLRFETVYSVDGRRPRTLRVVSRLSREARGEGFFIFGDVILHGVASLQAFTAHVGRPEHSPGFVHPAVDPDGTLSMVRGIRWADLQVLVGGEVPEPGVAYGVRVHEPRIERRDGTPEPLPFLALNGKSFSLLGVLANPLWLGGQDGLGLLELAQVPFMDLEVGESLVYERLVLLGERADVASLTDQVWPDAPRVWGWVDDASARLHVRRADGAPMTEVRPAADGGYAFRLPPGSYELEARTPDGRTARREIQVGGADVELEALVTGAPTRVALPRGAAMRLVFVGEKGTPDPDLGDDGIDLHFGDDAVAASRESNDISLAGLPGDPAAVALPPGRYRVLATRGPEYDVREARIEVEAGRTTSLVIEAPRRVLETPGWIAADLHVHAEPSDDSTFPLGERVASFAAQGAEVLVATDHDRVTDYGPLLRELGLAGEIASMMGAEVTTSVRGEANPHTTGHYNVFPLRRDPDAYREGTPAHEGRRLRSVIADVRALGGASLVQMNHPRCGKGADLCFFEHLSVAGEAFDPARPLADEPNRVLLERDAQDGPRDLDFDAMELLNGPSMDRYRRVRADWLSLLLQGEFRAATANSDSHAAREVVALPRTYVRMADDRPQAFDERAFVEAVRAGRSWGTTGPLLDVELGGAGPGERFRGAAGELRVRVRAAPWVPVSRARVLVNGAPADERPLAAGEELRVPLAFEGDSFVTVEVEGEPDALYRALAPEFVPFAFCNPIFVDADGDGAWSAPGLPARPPRTITDPGEL